MAKLNELINKLNELNAKHGNVEVNIYHSFDQKVSNIDEDNIVFNEESGNIDFIYNNLIFKI